MSVSSVDEAADAAAALSARRGDIVRGWADLPLFMSVFAGQRDDAEAAAGLVLDALIEVARSGRTDDFRAPSFDTIRDVLSRVTSVRLRAGGDLSQIVAEITELREPVRAAFDGEPGATMVPAALVTVSDAIGSVRVAAVAGPGHDGRRGAPVTPGAKRRGPDGRAGGHPLSGGRGRFQPGQPDQASDRGQ